MDKDSSDIMKGGNYIADVADDHWKGKHTSTRGCRGHGDRGDRGGYGSRGRGRKGGYKDSYEHSKKQEKEYFPPQKHEEYVSDPSWKEDVESIPIISPEAKFDDNEHKIDDTQPEMKKKGTSYGGKPSKRKGDSSKNAGKSFLPVVAGQDEYGTYDADGYYFDDVGYYDENGYFDDEGYYEVDDMN